MRQNGFSLVELVVIIGIIGILLSIVTLQFNTYTTKAAVEAQVKMMQSDLMTARSQSLFQKRSRAVEVTATQFSIYSSTVTAVTPVSQRTLKYATLSNGAGPIIINSNGLINDPSNGGRSICLSIGDNPATIDAIVLSTTRIQLGKWLTPGGFANDCKSANITQQ
jgi:prepilin-type N-terminal cleavage/methylation domain-containing protein